MIIILFLFPFTHLVMHGVINKMTMICALQRDVVASYLEGGKPVDEGVEDAFELLHEVNERVRTGIWVGDCFIYNNSLWRLNYCVGGEVKIVYSLKTFSSV
jgi:coatomer subunit beta'